MWTVAREMPCGLFRFPSLLFLLNTQKRLNHNKNNFTKMQYYWKYDIDPNGRNVTMETLVQMPVFCIIKHISHSLCVSLCSDWSVSSGSEECMQILSFLIFPVRRVMGLNKFSQLLKAAFIQLCAPRPAAGFFSNNICLEACCQLSNNNSFDDNLGTRRSSTLLFFFFFPASRLVPL